MCASRKLLSKEDYASQFLQRLYRYPQCEWCKDPGRRIHASGLCCSCYRLERNLAKLQGRLHEYKNHNQRTPSQLQLEVRIARRKVRLAKAEGSLYGSINTQEIDGVRIEHELSSLSRGLVKKDLFYGDANLFDWSFSPSQKRLILYLLSGIQREFMRRNRHRMAKLSAMYPNEDRK